MDDNVRPATGFRAWTNFVARDLSSSPGNLRSCALIRDVSARLVAGRAGNLGMAMQRHSILVGKCYRDAFGAVYRIVGFDGNLVQCILYHRTDRGLMEREHSDRWADFLADLQGEV